MMTDDLNRQIASPLRVRDAKAESQLMEKIAILQKEFAYIDADHNEYISREELYNYLDRKGGKEFDRAIANEIFDHMDKNHDNKVTINEFIKVYIEADEILRKKIETAKINKDYYKKQQEECLKKADEARSNEKLTQYGITQNSIAHVVVMEAKGIRPGSYAAPQSLFVEVSLDRQQVAKTKVLAVPDPVWNEKFTFEVVNPESQIRFAVFDQARSREDFEGEVIVPLKELRDQNIHDVWLDLFTRTGQKGRGQIHVKLQWIHSKTKYYAMVAQKWYENYVKEDEELQEYNRYLGSLHDPFQGLKNLGRYQGQTITPTDIPGLTELDRQFATLMNRAANALIHDPNPNENVWRRLALGACLIEVVVAILLMFNRPDFFDLLLPICFYLYLQYGLFKEVLSTRIWAFVILGSVVIYDFIWISIYSGNWTDTAAVDDNVEKTAKGFCIFFSFINIILKIAFAAICYMLNIHTIRTRGSVPRVVMSSQPYFCNSLGEINPLQP